MMAIQQYLESRWEMNVVTVERGSISVALDLNIKGPITNQVTFEWGKLAQQAHATSHSPRSKANTGSTKTHKRTHSGGL
jgi:hypothetical protein